MTLSDKLRSAAKMLAAAKCDCWKHGWDVPGLLEDAADLTRQRDELLATCRRFIEWDNDRRSLDVPTDISDEIRRAVNAVTYGSDAAARTPDSELSKCELEDVPEIAAMNRELDKLSPEPITRDEMIAETMRDRR